MHRILVWYSCQGSSSNGHDFDRQNSVGQNFVLPNFVQTKLRPTKTSTAQNFVQRKFMNCNYLIKTWLKLNQYMFMEEWRVINLESDQKGAWKRDDQPGEWSTRRLIIYVDHRLIIYVDHSVDQLLFIRW